MKRRYLFQFDRSTGLQKSNQNQVGRVLLFMFVLPCFKIYLNIHHCKCSLVLCCLSFVAWTSWILESLESSPSAKPSIIYFFPLLSYLNAIGCIIRKWFTILDKMAALFVPCGDLVDLNVVGTLLKTAASPSLPAFLNRFSKSW